MAKHRLRVMPGRSWDDGTVALRCMNCPRYVRLPRDFVYDLLVNGSKALKKRTNAEQVREWAVCTPLMPLKMTFEKVKVE